MFPAMPEARQRAASSNRADTGDLPDHKYSSTWWPRCFVAGTESGSTIVGADARWDRASESEAMDVKSDEEELMTMDVVGAKE